MRDPNYTRFTDGHCAREGSELATKYHEVASMMQVWSDKKWRAVSQQWKNFTPQLLWVGKPSEMEEHCFSSIFPLKARVASHVALVVKNPPTNSGDIRDTSLIPGSGRSPGEGHSNPLQYSCLENPMDRVVWWATVHSIAKSQTRLKWLSTVQLTAQYRLNADMKLMLLFWNKLYSEFKRKVICLK